MFSIHAARRQFCAYAGRWRWRKVQPVRVEDGVTVGLCVAAGFQKTVELLQIGDRIESERSLVAPESSIEVRPNGDVTAIVRQLANVIDLIHQAIQGGLFPRRAH